MGTWISPLQDGAALLLQNKPLLLPVSSPQCCCFFFYNIYQHYLLCMCCVSGTWSSFPHKDVNASRAGIFVTCIHPASLGVRLAQRNTRMTIASVRMIPGGQVPWGQLWPLPPDAQFTQQGVLELLGSLRGGRMLYRPIPYTEAEITSNSLPHFPNTAFLPDMILNSLNLLANGRGFPPVPP